MMQEEKKEVALKILSVLAAVGVVTVVSVAPGLSVTLPLFIGGKRVPKKRVQPALQYALRRRWVSVEGGSAGQQLVLTSLGRRKYAEHTFGPETIRVPKRWDKKWRVVIFDIPNRKKRARETLRETLRRMAFRQLQESVWIHPYPCEQVIYEVAMLYEVTHYVQFLLVKKFSKEGEFLHKFNLVR